MKSMSSVLRDPHTPQQFDPAYRWHHYEVAGVLELLRANDDVGLSAKEIERRRLVFGRNVVTARLGKPPWLRFLLQFHQPLLYLLLAAVGVTAFLHEWVDAAVIFGVVLINAVIGFLQEAKAEKAVDALSQMVATETTVRREGKRMRILASELVPGDLVLLQSGDRVPADIRLTKVHSLQVDESALTGESLAVDKHHHPVRFDAVLAERANQVFAGTHVTYGSAEGVVWATGDCTETGRIATMIAKATEIATPLTKKIAVLSRIMLWAIMGLAGLAFYAGVSRGEPAPEVFLSAVALAVGAIPEGLPAAVTIVLAIGVSRMAKRRAIIRKLPAVETLGSTTVVCSDKTGTLTENQMTVQRCWAAWQEFEFTGVGYDSRGKVLLAEQHVRASSYPALWECLRAGVLCNDSLVAKDDRGRAMIQGDPTEGAMLVAGAKAGLLHEQLLDGAPRHSMIPFESQHMFRATLHATEEGRVIYQAGALEKLLDRCVDMLDPHGQHVPLDRDAIVQAMEQWASAGLRIIGLARKHPEHEEDLLDHHHVSSGMTFLGLQGMMDPPRAEAVESIASCHRAGIRVKMITGDHALTARAIARALGIGGDNGEVVSGRDLELISDEALPELADRVDVFARVAPEQKWRLVKALQKFGHIVAMTGDGVNDAPALQQSDIGIAMGIAGTDVAKGAADMVLTDDNFATIQAAVEEGRGVFDNLRKFIVWTLPTNIGEGSIILVAMLFGFTLPVVPVQLLWVNMATAIFLGLMLVFEPKEKGLMDRPPRDPKQPLLTYPLMMRTGLISLIMILGGYWLYFYETNMEKQSIESARTAVVNVIVMVEVAYLMCCRSLNHSWLSVGIFRNPYALCGAAAMILAQCFFTYAPVMNHLFHTAPLGQGSWWRIGFVAVLALAAVELEKWLRFGRGKEPLAPSE
jgi:cation-transporting ATPase F